MLAATVIAFVGLAALAAPAAAQKGLVVGAKMPAAGLELHQVGGGSATLSGVAGEAGTVVIFWSDECPWVSRYQQRVLELASSFTGRGVSFVLVNSEPGVTEGRAVGELPYLLDSKSEVATAFGAARTPHVYFFDASGDLAYVGAIDDSPGDANNVKTYYLRDALDAILSGSAVSSPQTKSFGCVLRTK